MQRRAVGQVGLLDPHVDDLDAILARDAVEPGWILSITPPRSGLSSATKRRLPSSLRSAEPRIGRSASVTRCSALRAEMYHPQRIDDAEAREGVDLEPQLVGRQHLLAVHVDVEHALVDPHDASTNGMRAIRPAPVGRSAFALLAVDDAHRLAEADDDRLLGFGHDREGAEQRSEAARAARGTPLRHWVAQRIIVGHRARLRGCGRR